jgi:hypothetical protein
VVVALEERRDRPSVDLATQSRPQLRRQSIADQIIHLGQIERRHRRCQVDRRVVGQVERARMRRPGPVGFFQPRKGQVLDGIDEFAPRFEPLGQRQPV